MSRNLGWAARAGLACLLATLLSGQSLVADEVGGAESLPTVAVDRSPADLKILPGGQRLVTANQTAGTVSLVDTATGQVLHEVACGRRPTTLALLPGNRLLASASYSGELFLFDVQPDRLAPAATLPLGFEPRGIAVTADGGTAYVALTAANQVAVVDVACWKETGRIDVGRWPRHVALSLDGTRLAVGSDGDRSVSVVDPVAGRMLYLERYDGINSGQMQVSADGTFVYFPSMLYRHNPINERNIRLGWVLASRINRIRLDGPARRQAMSLDVPGEAIADPYGLAISPDQEWLVVAAAGTHELLVYRLPGLPFQDHGGPGDVIDPALRMDDNRFYRIPLGGRPMGVTFADNPRRVLAANYLLNCVQEVDLDSRQVVRTLPLGGPAEPSLARRGEAIFFDGRRSLDQWYSCHTCHCEGGTNAVAMDTQNDGSDRTFKTVLSLYNVADTAPWTWHGWQQDLETSLHKSLVDSMLGPPPSAEDVAALSAYLQTLELPPNPYRLSDGGLTEAAARGEAVFNGERAGCANCHSGPYFTDGQIHDVGLGSEKDVYHGYNTPSLLGIHNRTQYLHHGRAKSLEALLTGLHNPAQVTGLGELTPAEQADLIAYLKSL